MKTHLIVLTTLLLGGSAFGAVHVSLLGSTELFKDFINQPDVDKIHLGSCGNGSDNPAVQKVKVRVHENDIYLEEIVATFGNGQRQYFSVNKHYSEGQESPWIDLKGNVRCIESLKIVGNTTTENIWDAIVGSRATVEVWGMRKSAPVSAIKKLAAKPVKYGKFNNYKNHQVMIKSCATGKGKLRKLRIVAKHGRMKVKNFRVTFGNGSTQLLSFKNGFFTRGQRSQFKDLKGNRRCIKKVNFKAFSPNGAKIIIQGR